LRQLNSQISPAALFGPAGFYFRLHVKDKEVRIQ
jgi:hypothetical protein